MKKPIRSRLAETFQTAMASDGTDNPRPNHSSSTSSCSNTAVIHRSVDEPLCRICQCGPSNELLLSPCQCKGSLAQVHRTCLEKWLGQSNRTKCEICRTPYHVQRTARPFGDWLRNPSTLADRQNMIADCMCFAILLPLSTMSSWLCITGAAHFLATNRDSRGKYEAIGLVVVTVFLLIVFVGWFVISVRYHCAVWAEWRDSHLQVRLLSWNNVQHKLVENEPTTAPPPTSTSMLRMAMNESEQKSGTTESDTVTAVNSNAVVKTRSRFYLETQV